jgi:hypothetical protein
MISKLLFLSALLTPAVHVAAQCVTAGFVPCLVPGASVAAAPPALTLYDSNALFSSLDSAIADFNPGLERRDPQRSDGFDAYHVLERRQSSLCCRPKPVECLYADNVPFCYVRACPLPALIVFRASC